MQTITIEITEAEGNLIFKHYQHFYKHQLYASVEKPNGKYDLEILDADKFREFLNSKLKMKWIDNIGEGWKYLSEDEKNNLKSILSKLDKEVI